MNGTATLDEADKDPDAYCQILGKSFTVDELPEWVFNAEGWPTCTAFVQMGETIPAPCCERTIDLFNNQLPPEPEMPESEGGEAD
jgi:hypothetical protein